MEGSNQLTTKLKPTTMNDKEIKLLANAIGNCSALTTKQKLDVAENIANTLMWINPRRKNFLVKVEQFSGLTKIREKLTLGEAADLLALRKDNYKHVKAHLREIDMTITKQDDEYRVNYINGKEGTAYYTNDLEDAYNTGVAMADRRVQQYPNDGTMSS